MADEVDSAEDRKDLPGGIRISGHWPSDWPERETAHLMPDVCEFEIHGKALIKEDTLGDLDG